MCACARASAWVRTCVCVCVRACVRARALVCFDYVLVIFFVMGCVLQHGEIEHNRVEKQQQQQ